MAFLVKAMFSQERLLMRKVIGCIGCGNMGSAIMGGFAKRLSKDDYHLCIYSRTEQKMAPMRDLGIEIMPGIAETAANSDILIFAVKPQQMPEVLQEAQPRMTSEKAAISIAAGVSISRMRMLLGDECFISRCMPTTTALVGHGVFAFCADPAVLMPDIKNEIIKLLQVLGLCVELPESGFTPFSAFIGAGPAYIFAMMQGLVQAGITLGFNRPQSEKMLVELLAGCWGLANQENKSFMELRDAVCSPGGLTIAGINTLDRAGFTGLIVEAVEKAAKRGKEMES